MTQRDGCGSWLLMDDFCLCTGNLGPSLSSLLPTSGSRNRQITMMMMMMMMMTVIKILVRTTM